MEPGTAPIFENTNNPYGYAPAFWRRTQERRRSEEQTAAKLAELQHRQERVEALRKLEEQQNRSPAPPVIRTIIEEVAAKHGIPTHSITGKCHSRKVFAARHEAIRAVANARPEWSLGMIGRVFGGRHHTSIMCSLAKTRKPGDWR